MGGKNVELIIDLVKRNLMSAERACKLGDYDFADNELSKLREMLDDIYATPEEAIEAEESPDE